MYKIPGRDIYCETLGGWFKEMLWVYVVRVFFRFDIEKGVASEKHN